jgi:two-component system, OmpR family, alkaline phosphatase synthesis response regulator PhoP
MKRILVVDDEPFIREILSYNLRQNGYEVFEAENGHKALEILDARNFDLILLDIMLPVLDGFKTAKEMLISKPQQKFMFLTARVDEETEIEAFGLGAFDFIQKPIKAGALLSRINSFFEKNIVSEKNPEELSVGKYLLNKSAYVVKHGSQEERLPRKEFELLWYLALRPDMVFSRLELIAEIWGKDLFISERTVDVHIRKIREKLEEIPIETIKGVGYILKTI